MNQISIQKAMRLVLALLLLLSNTESIAMELTPEDDQLIEIKVGERSEGKYRSIKKQLYKSHLMLSKVVRDMLKYQEMAPREVLDLSSVPLSIKGWDDLTALLAFAFHDETKKAEDYIYTLDAMHAIEVLNSISFLNIEALEDSAIKAMVRHINDDYTNAYRQARSDLNAEWKLSIAKKLLPIHWDLKTIVSPTTLIAWSSDGKYIASSIGDKMIRIWNSVSRELLHTLGGHGDCVSSVAWSPDDQYIASGSCDGTVYIWDNVSRELLHTLQGHTKLVSSVAWSPHGNFIVSGSYDGMVRIWDSASGGLRHTLGGNKGAVNSVAWSPNGRFIASGSDDGMVRIWDSVSGELLHTLQGYISMVNSVVWSPDGQFIASGSSDKTIRIWKSISGELLHTLRGHTGVVVSVAWSPNGKLIASGSWDATLRIWDSVSGKLLSILPGYTELVKSVAWSPDGRFLAVGANDAIRLWEILPMDYSLSETAVMLKTLAGKPLNKNLVIDNFSINEQKLYDGFDDDIKSWLNGLPKAEKTKKCTKGSCCVS